ncbi:MAG: hypothetical protein ABIV51_10990 [Saprospiraceae bacterium]
MKSLHYIFIFLLVGTLSNSLEARPPSGKIKQHNQELKPRLGDCAAAKSQIDQNINNVRARLTTGGDIWWNLSEGHYIVPNIDPGSGLPQVSSIFASSIWIGAYDLGGNLKLAANTYRSENHLDWWPGPLTVDGKTGKDTCAIWDRFFSVLGDDIRTHIDNFRKARLAGEPYKVDDIPKSVLGWPGKSNPHFKSVHGVDFPGLNKGMAAYWDEDDSDDYDPTKGDYPIIGTNLCTSALYADEMIFWVYNDVGGNHSSSKGAPIGMEVQAQSFAFATNDELNNMTFQRYKLINRASQDLIKTYFAIWVDPDLGCGTDDFVGCDTSRNLMYVYNEDEIDGSSGCDCEGGIPTYCNDVPILGIDILRGPLDEIGNEIKMSSFTYYNNSSLDGLIHLTEPELPIEYYRYMSGFWKDGSPLTQGGSGYGGSITTKYAFPNEPNEVNAWSMCNVSGLKGGDRKTIQAAGPFTLQSGAISEMIIGVPWVADQLYPCPDLSELQAADDIAQNLFDNCWGSFAGPDAPILDIIELDRSLIFVLSNDSIYSNNKFLSYNQRVPNQPSGFLDTVYLFEGYKIFQLQGHLVNTYEYDNPDKSRLVAQVDLQNSVEKIYNWKGIKDPNPQEASLIFVPEEKVNGANTGLRSTFKITEDAFATTQDHKLINHKKYYYVAVAYAHNNYLNFDHEHPLGSQKTPYLEGKGGIPNSAYVGIPRPIVDTDLYAEFGDGAIITRLDGQGSGGANLDLADGIREQIILGQIKDSLTYKEGRGPLRVHIYNPIDISDGEFELTFTDQDISDGVLDTNARWNLVNLSKPGETILSHQSIEGLNEQVMGKYGFSIIISQIAEPGAKTRKSNGFVAKSVAYADSDQNWFRTFNDVDPQQPVEIIPAAGLFNFVKNGASEPDLNLDPDAGLTQFVKGGKSTTFIQNVLSYSTDGSSFVPFLLADYRYTPGQPYLSPALLDGTSNMQSFVRNFGSLAKLNNVDIVMTPNKALWSRCVVLETASRYYEGKSQGGALMLDLRKLKADSIAPSVSKEDANNDGLPDLDGDTLRGMGWFPGYAIDVETGKRLNIMFGENSFYGPDYQNYVDSFKGQPDKIRGRDMMYNPSDQMFMLDLVSDPMGPLYLGGQHFIYVSNTGYDSCFAIHKDLINSSQILRTKAYRSITWAAMTLMAPGKQMKSYADGLIPTETVVRLRVDSEYANSGISGINKGNPKYRFKIEGKAAKPIDKKLIDVQLDQIGIVPNPYYAYSQYENSASSSIVKITNLPAKCVVTIYTLDGKFIRQFKRNEIRNSSNNVSGIQRNDPGLLNTLIAPDLEWDMKNARGISVASGIYMIHVNAEGLGERVLKWFNVKRE